MKKWILNLLVSNILVVNLILVTSCSTVQETNFILDLNDDVNDENLIVTSRGWKGTLLDPDSIKNFLESNDSSYISFENEQLEVIKKFTRALHIPASKEANKKFDSFLNQKRFLTFNDLVDTINNHNLNSGENSYIDVPLEIIRDHAVQPHLFEEIMLKIYNTMSSFFGKNYGYKILRTLAIAGKAEPDSPSVLAVTAYNWRSIWMKVGEKEIKTNDGKDQYYNGSFSVPYMFSTFAHEFGHVIDFFHRSSYGFHESVDNFSGLHNEFSFGSDLHNEYKRNYCASWKQNKRNCPYKISTKDSTDREKSKSPNYSLDQTEALMDFILKKVKNLKIPGKTAAAQCEFEQEMLLRILINSNYGRSKLAEVHAEGFAYWLLTPENERTKAWEIWNEFFLDYLPKLRAAIPHFNDYLENHNS